MTIAPACVHFMVIERRTREDGLFHGKCKNPGCGYEETYPAQAPWEGGIRAVKFFKSTAKRRGQMQQGAVNANVALSFKTIAQAAQATRPPRTAQKGTPGWGIYIRQMAAWLKANRPSIEECFKALGTKETRELWEIPSSTFSGLLKSWKLAVPSGRAGRKAKVPPGGKKPAGTSIIKLRGGELQGWEFLNCTGQPLEILLNINARMLFVIPPARKMSEYLAETVKGEPCHKKSA